MVLIFNKKKKILNFKQKKTKMKTTDLVPFSENELKTLFTERPETLFYLQNLLRYRQFSEDFLIKYLHYFDSRVCLNFQKNLTPQFCFKYLYDSKTDKKTDDWVCFNDIVWYFRDRYTAEELENSFLFI